MWEVLHHALQPRAALEGRPCVILVLGVDKLRNDALRLLQGRQVALRLQDELINVACAIMTAWQEGQLPKIVPIFSDSLVGADRPLQSRHETLDFVSLDEIHL